MLNVPTLPSDLDVDLAGLSAVAGTWFAKLPVSDQRIQSVPDGRTLRFYQSTGLLDRPLRYDGRVARYGPRHLLQLLAVRALQSQGNSLAQIQASLAGATNTNLAQTVDAALGLGAAMPPGAGLVAAPAPAPGTRGVDAPAGRATTAGLVAPTPIVAAELVPGVLITIDSRVHTDPARVIATLRRALQGEET